jgi:membrane-associated phospholipid phosphatase
MPSDAADHWLGALAIRLRQHFWLKTLAITLAISAFMVIYLWLAEHPRVPITAMPALAPDRWIAFTPWALVPYLSLWIYIGAVPALLEPRRELPPYLLCAVLLAVIGCVVYVIFPNAVVQPAIDWSQWPILAWLKAADQTRNACPSLHIAYAVLTVIWLHRLLGQIGAPRWTHIVNVLWCLAIVWSTLALRQHVLLDVLAGATLAAVAAWWVPRLRSAW